MSDSGSDRLAPALLLAAEAPYPLTGGGALRSASLLTYLARTRPVDVVVFRQPGAPDPAADIPPGLARRAWSIPLPANSRRLPARVWRNGARLLRGAPPLIDRFAGFGRAIGEAVGGRRYGVGVVEHFWLAPYQEQLAAFCRRTVLDLHNVESCLHFRCAQAERGPAAFAHRVFGSASARLESLWLPRYSLVLTASEEDARLARALAPSARVEVYPNAIPLPAPRAGAREHAIVFSGNMEYHPNVTAVRYFRREIWPLLRERWPALVWRLVGRNPEAVRKYVDGDPRIELVGPVADAVAELARARVAVVPLLSGSGTRFKILEAWAAGAAVVSTTLGAEGLGATHGENILLADSPEEFAGAVSRLLSCGAAADGLAISGRRLFEHRFTWECAWKELDF